MDSDLAGKVYTPRHVASLLARVALEELTARQPLSAQLRVIDPACGDGSLLRAFGDELRQRPQAWQVEFRGIDADPSAIASCNMTLTRAGFPVLVQQLNLLDEPPERLASLIGTGFDLVLANPPFVRQEAIPPILKLALRKRFPGFSSRSDLFVYFFPAMAALLKPGGILAAITPWSWLDVQYGLGFKRFLLSNFHVKRIICPSASCWFPSVSVRPLIVVLSRKEAPHEAHLASDTRFQLALEDTEGGFRLKTVYTLSGHEELDPGPRKWSTFFYVKSVASRLEEAMSRHNTTVADVANVRFGVKTGANEFFYFKPATDGRHVNQSGIPLDGCSSRPVIKSLRRVVTYAVDVDAQEYRCVWFPGARERLSPLEKRYVEWGESMGFDRRPTCRNREPWFALPCPRADLVVPMSRGTRLGSPLIPDRNAKADEEPVIDARFYAVEVKGITPRLLGALVNSSPTWLLIELHGRPLVGNLPLLDLKIYELESIPLPNPYLGTESLIERFEAAFAQMLDRPMYDVFREITLDDRHLLDMLFLELVGITGTAAQHMMAELYAMLCSRVRDRLWIPDFNAPRR